jgi:hypothetical protein
MREGRARMRNVCDGVRDKRHDDAVTDAGADRPQDRLVVSVPSGQARS